MALVECKAGARGRHSPGIDMQEVAQLVAWVKQDPAGPGADNRILLSKVGLELYHDIPIFQYEPGWLRYLVILLTPLPFTGATQIRCSASFCLDLASEMFPPRWSL